MMDDRELLNRHEVQIESLLKESEKMDNEISDINKTLAVLAENVVKMGQLQSQIVELSKKLSYQGESMQKLESDRRLAYANTSNDIKNINSRLDSGMEHFKRLDTSIEKIEKNSSEQYKKIVYWFAGIIGTIIVGYIASRLGLKV
jgi:chromosome segregation ATPase